MSPYGPFQRAWRSAAFLRRAGASGLLPLLGRPAALLQEAHIGLVIGHGMAGCAHVSRVSPVHTALRNCTRDEGRSFEVGNQVLISSHPRCRR